MKKMIKSFAIAAAMLLTTSVIAEDTSSYLYWMSDGLNGFNGAWSYAKVAYNGADTGYLGVSTGGDQFEKSQLFVGGNFRSMQVLIGSTVLSDSYKFALELFDNSDQSVGISQWLAYSPDFIGDQSMTSSSYAQFGFQIPEPTSGLLMMMGFGLLALRRKQKKA